MTTNATTAHVRAPRNPAWGKIAVIVLVFAALALAWRYTPLADWITVDRVMGWARAVGKHAWSPVLVAAAYVPAEFVMFPRPLVTLFSAIAFGPWMGFATSIAGISAAALALYGAGRALPEGTIRRLAGTRLAKTSRALRRRGFAAVLAVTLAPVAPHPLISIVAGAIGIRLWQYLAGTVIGMAPGTLTTIVFARQIEAALEEPSKINYWLVGAAVVLLIVLFIAARRWLMRAAQETAAGPEAAAAP
jgi:uncharacterized membrane protein YdjX (TVP38/TMEM64 family)